MKLFLQFVTLFIATLYFTKQVNSIHIAFIMPDIINIYPIYSLNYNMLTDYNIVTNINSNYTQYMI